MKKILIIPFLFFVYVMSAAPVNQSRAREIALEFFNSDRTKSAGIDVELEWAGDSMESQHLTRSISNVDNALLYIYNRTDGKGFVIVAGDDNVRPIIGYSRTNTFDVEDMPDGARYLLSSWCKQVEASKLEHTSAGYSVKALSEGVPVKEYPTAFWGQGEPYNRFTPLYEGEHCLTGCVATAMSIVSHYHKWPLKGSGKTPAYESVMEGITISVPENDISAHTYDHENMLESYQGISYNDIQANAVAVLMSDMGTSVKMNYSPGSSGALDINSINAFVTYFQYSKSALLFKGSCYSQDVWIEMLRENLENYGPTCFFGKSAIGGHAFVLDGYDSNNYFRINYGWEGKSYGYYYIPEISYSDDQSAIFSLAPDKTGTSEYQDNLTIGVEEENEPHSKGIVSDALRYVDQTPFTITLGRIYNSGLTDFNGHIKISLCDKDGNIKEDLSGEVPIENLSPENYTRVEKISNLKITETINSGDRLRVYAKGAFSSSWKLCGKYNEESENEVFVAAYPEQIAESLYLSFDKGAGIISFKSDMFLEYLVKDSSDAVVFSGAVEAYAIQSIDISEKPKGTYTFSFSSGGDPYILEIVL